MSQWSVDDDISWAETIQLFASIIIFLMFFVFLLLGSIWFYQHLL